jgi:hypothetical protein
MQGDLETGDPLGQGREWGFIAYFCIAWWREMPFRCKQAFPREEKCLLDHLSPFGTSCSLSFSPSASCQYHTVLVAPLHSDCNMPHEVSCGIFHLWCLVCAQNLLDFGFHIFGLGMFSLYLDNILSSNRKKTKPHGHSWSPWWVRAVRVDHIKQGGQTVERMADPSQTSLWCSSPP